MQVLAFANPLRMKHDRGTTLETVSVASPTENNPLDFGDSSFFAGPSARRPSSS